jgi:type I restriction enzyme S subunit
VDVYYNDFIDLSIDFMEVTANFGEITKFQLKEKDVLITKDSEDPLDIGVPAIINKVKDKLLCGYHLSMLRSKSNKISGDYLFWLLKDTSIASQLWREATGVTRWAIASRHIKNTSIPIPPKNEQVEIVTYLKKACERIDKIIEIKKEQIKKVEEHLNSKFFELLTGKKYESIETNYPYFKTMPKNWKIIRVKSVVTKVNSGVTPKGGATSYVDEGIPLIRSQNVKSIMLDFSDVVFITEATHNKMKNSKVKNGDVLLNITGASLGRCYFVKGIDEANVNQHVCILRPSDLIETKYLYYLIKSEIGQSQIFSGFKGSGREGLSFEAIKKFRFPLPNKEQQRKIIFDLDELSLLVNNEKKIIKEQIAVLKKYRTNLIHESITGKKQIVKTPQNA